MELTRQLAARGDVVFATCRNPAKADALQELQSSSTGRIVVLQLDVTDGRSIEAAAQEVAAHPLAIETSLPFAPSSSTGAAGVDLLINVAGVLQDRSIGIVPERSLSQIDVASVVASFMTNSIGPLLMARSFAPLLSRASDAAAAAVSAASGSPGMPHSTAVFYSARVGSIGDNGTGGWYSYRGSKAALNQFVRCMSHELKRQRVCCVTFHPGTVDTDLTRAFLQARAKYDVQSVEDAVRNHLEIFDGLSMRDTGSYLDWRRANIPW